MGAEVQHHCCWEEEADGNQAAEVAERLWTIERAERRCPSSDGKG